MQSEQPRHIILEHLANQTVGAFGPALKLSLNPPVLLVHHEPMADQVSPASITSAEGASRLKHRAVTVFSSIVIPVAKPAQLSR